MQNQQNHVPDTGYTKWAGTALGLSDLGMQPEANVWRVKGDCNEMTELARRVANRAEVAGFITNGTKIGDAAGKTSYPMPVTKDMELVLDIKQLTSNTCVLDIWVG